MNNKGIGVTVLALLVLVIFAVNKIYEDHHTSNLPLVLEVDEADLYMVDVEPTSISGKLALPPDNFKRSAQRYLPQGLLNSFQDNLNPWLSSKNKIVTKRAIVFAKRVQTKTSDAQQKQQLVAYDLSADSGLNADDMLASSGPQLQQQYEEGIDLPFGPQQRKMLL